MPARDSTHPIDAFLTERRVTLLVVLIGALLRLTGLTSQSLWLDEGFSLAAATSADPTPIMSTDGHPPLFASVLRIWVAMFGPAAGTARMVPALASVAALAIVAWGLRTRRSPGGASTLALTLYAGLPFLVWYARELRPYAFLELGAAAMFTGWQLVRARRTAIGLGVAAAGAAFAMWSHYFGLFALGSVALLAIVDPEMHGPRWRLPAVLLLAGATALPTWADMLPEQMAVPWGAQWRLTLTYLVSLPLRLVVAQGGSLPSALVGLVGLALVGLLPFVLRTIWRGDVGWNWLLALLGITAPIIATLIASLLVEPRFTARYFIMVPLYLCILLGYAATSWPRRRTLIVAAGILALFSATDLWLRTEDVNDGYRSACASVRERWQPGDRIGVITSMPLDLGAGPLPAYLGSDILADGYDLTYEPGWNGSRTNRGRLHLIVRLMEYVQQHYDEVTEGLPIVYDGPLHNGVKHILVEWPE